MESYIEKKITVIMPTYNSERTIEKSLSSIRSQNYNQEKVEILVIDGGSTDKTLDIAKKYNCTVLANEKRLPEFAKEIGLFAATGDFCVFIDSDEVLLNPNSFSKRVSLFINNKAIKNIVSYGVKTPDNMSTILKYMNYTGDPFTFFLYRVNNCKRFRDYSKKYHFDRTCDYACFYFSKSDVLPVIDALATMFETKYAKDLYIKCDDKENFCSSLFDKMVKETRCCGMVFDDIIFHIDPSDINKFIKKLDFRVKNNLSSDNVAVGFNSRAKSNRYLTYKKYLFLPYCMFIFPVLFDTFFIMIKDRAPYFFWHFLLSYYVFFDIVMTVLKKVFFVKKEKISTYG